MHWGLLYYGKRTLRMFLRSCKWTGRRGRRLVCSWKPNSTNRVLYVFMCVCARDSFWFPSENVAPKHTTVHSEYIWIHRTMCFPLSLYQHIDRNFLTDNHMCIELFRCNIEFIHVILMKTYPIQLFLRPSEFVTIWYKSLYFSFVVVIRFNFSCLFISIFFRVFLCYHFDCCSYCYNFRCYFDITISLLSSNRRPIPFHSLSRRHSPLNKKRENAFWFS